jgi:nicotinamide mononucleotide adenylyltransferase
MLKGDPWKNLSPPTVVQVLKEIDGVERLRQISQKD